MVGPVPPLTVKVYPSTSHGQWSTCKLWCRLLACAGDGQAKACTTTFPSLAFGDTVRSMSQAPGQPPANTESFLPQSTVMIVDDNVQNVELLQAFLEALPVKIITANDGVEALEKVDQHNPDLILLDIMMPRMSGFQVCRTLKGNNKTKEIQILMVTALNELGDIEQASECGTDDFVSKPVNKFELLTRVKSLLRVRHLKSELERALTYLNEVEQEEESDSPAGAADRSPR